MREWSDSCFRAGERIGFVPTMGCLHEGHMSLVRLAREMADVTVVSIFVNPTQFGPGEDFERYPRVLGSDLSMCEATGVDAVFTPAVSEMYAEDASTIVEEAAISRGMCGASRPGHFRGVATVVAKLFNIVKPAVAVFGRKDAQQLMVIKRMVRDLNFPVEIVAAPIVRESDGLAMSSRNRYLSADERMVALGINRALRWAEARYANGERSARSIAAGIGERISGGGVAVPEYVEVVAAEDMKPVSELGPGIMIAVAARVGATRLIDNVVLGVV